MPNGRTVDEHHLKIASELRDGGGVTRGTWFGCPFI
jgi:hypothetical protein